jgi:hypothetical protein
MEAIYVVLYKVVTHLPDYTVSIQKTATEECALLTVQRYPAYADEEYCGIFTQSKICGARETAVASERL